MMINDLVFDIFLHSLESTKNIHCFLCNCKLYQPKRVENYPPEYRICCVCKKMLSRFAENHFSYNDILKLVERTIDKIILSQGKLKIRHFSKSERECVWLFMNQSLIEKDAVLDKFRLFFLR